MSLESTALSTRTGPLADNERVRREEDDDVHLSRFRRLTPREVQLLVLVVRDGLGRADVGERLEMSPAAVANTLQRVRRKLGVPAHQDLGQFVGSIRSLALECSVHGRIDKQADHRPVARVHPIAHGQRRRGRRGPRDAVVRDVCVTAGTAADTSAQVDDIIGYLVHELASPLTVITGYAEMAMRHADGELEVFLAAIERSADDLRRRVALLDEVRGLSSGEMRLDRRNVDIGQLVASLVGDLAPELAPHPVTVTTDEGGGSQSAAVDPSRLRQAVSNLLTNAAKFSHRDAPIEVTVKNANGGVEIAVRDHGSGVPQARRSELFRRFARLGSQQKGMGLGLYLARTIARAHSGDVLYDDAPGGGSCFAITLPSSSCTT